MRTLALILCAVASLCFGNASAQNFPSRPVTIIVPYLAGGSTDVVIRALAAATEKHLGQPILIENRAGANGVNAPLQMAATAQPDGYTIAQIPESVLKFPFMAKTSFDPIKDLTYIIGVSSYLYGLVVRTDQPWTTLEEMIAYAAANPDRISYGTTGAGSGQHLMMVQLAKQRGIKWSHLPFRGDADMLNVLLGGHIQAVAGSTTWAPLVDSGKLRLLAVAGSERMKRWPGVPTLKESGFDLVLESPYGLAGPKTMDPKVVKVLHDSFKKGMAESSFLMTLEKLDQELWYRSSEEYLDSVMRSLPELKRRSDDFLATEAK